MEKAAKKRAQPRSIKTITRRIFIFTFILWAAAMGGATFIVAQIFYNEFLHRQLQFSQNAAQLLRETYEDEARLAEVKSRPGGISELMQRTFDERLWTGHILMPPQRTLGNRFLQRVYDFLLPSFYRFQTAAMFIDTDGNIIHDGSGIVSMRYIPQDVWLRLQTSEEMENALAGSVQFSLGAERRMPPTQVIRVTGFPGDRHIHPVKISYVTHQSIDDAFDKAVDLAREGVMFTEFFETGYTEAGHFYETFWGPPISALDSAGLLQWQLMFDDTAEYENAEGLVTVVGTWPWTVLQDPGRVVTAGSVRYDNLMSFLSENRHEPFALHNSFPLDAGDRRLSNIVVAHAQPFTDFSDFGPDFDEFPEPDFIMLTAIHGNPLRYTVGVLARIYNITLLIALLGAVLLTRMIRRNLTEPLEAVNKGIAEGWTHLVSFKDKPPKWRESFELLTHYEKTKEQLQSNKNELTRLNTALDYAKEAEQNRRQTTSNIAHELKTPLAIIHSYSEGLKERIAEEKREHYLDVILAESERMDAMVLEMLDLSRLEAGKVKLARDEFSLSQLAQSVFDKLEMAITEKELNISYDLQGDCTVGADEARINQVISNFAANAVKYTPHGGAIFVKTYTDRGKTGFSVENDSDPLTPMELSKVWETFYQADNARTGQGTGLGLAIAKSIIELHGGKCFARNTKSGVEFGFVI
jgi:signal transduction histidine kinase